MEWSDWLSIAVSRCGGVACDWLLGGGYVLVLLVGVLGVCVLLSVCLRVLCVSGLMCGCVCVNTAVRARSPPTGRDRGASTRPNGLVSCVGVLMR